MLSLFEKAKWNVRPWSQTVMYRKECRRGSPCESQEELNKPFIEQAMVLRDLYEASTEVESTR